MATSQICSSCLEHFDLARLDLMEGIRKLKRQALEDAIRDDYGDVAIQKLRNDLQRYERTTASEYEMVFLVHGTRANRLRSSSPHDRCCLYGIWTGGRALSRTSANP